VVRWRSWSRVRQSKLATDGGATFGEPTRLSLDPRDEGSGVREFGRELVGEGNEAWIERASLEELGEDVAWAERRQQGA
jgi:hypothetical protein